MRIFANRRARARGVSPDELAAEVADWLPESGSVALVGAAEPVAEALRTRLAAASVHAIGEEQVRPRHLACTIAGPFDAIIDLGGAARSVRRFQDLFFHLRPGGWYLLAGGRRNVSAMAAWLAEVARAPEPGRPGAQPGAAGRDAYAMRHSLGEVSHAAAGLRVTAGFAGALAKLDEPSGNEFLRQRAVGRDAGLVAIAAAKPPVRVESRCVLRQNTTDLPKPYLRWFEVPELALREVRGALVAPGQVVAWDNALLPDTYRHNGHDRLRNPYTKQFGHWFARFADDREPEPLAGTWYHLDNEERGHFGHAMTEQLSRVWGWREALQLDPDAKVLLGATKGRDLRGWERTLWEAADIPAERIEVIDRPVRVERLLTATPMFCMPEYIHPAITETWRELGDRLIAQAGDGPTPERIFCTRGGGKRACHNAAEVEAVFAERGYQVLRPETWSLPDQARMFRNARAVAGFAGSAMFGTLFATQPQDVFTIGSRRYGPTNEYLIASAHGHRLSQIFCEPDEWEFNSPYRFDFERDGALLRSWLDERS